MRTVKPEMTAKNAAELYRLFEQNDIQIWIDGGGWAVDALVGKQTRSHAELLAACIGANR